MIVYFVDFRFDDGEGRLWRGDDEIALRPKTAAVLRCLVSHPGDVVSKQTLLEEVWRDGFVGDAVLSGCVNELRNALGDDSRRPAFIATVSRRGFRFIAPVSARPQPVEAPGQQLFVGRDQEIAMLRTWWQRACAGERQTVFVAAPAGVGKSTLIDAFAREVRSDGDGVIAIGQCADQFGEGEAYLPVLDALQGLTRGPVGHRVIAVLRSLAPSWLLQLPGVLDPGERNALDAHAWCDVGADDAGDGDRAGRTDREPIAAAGAGGSPRQRPADDRAARVSRSPARTGAG